MAVRASSRMRRSGHFAIRALAKRLRNHADFVVGWSSEKLDRHGSDATIHHEIRQSTTHNMRTDASERYFLRQYLAMVEPHIDHGNCARILDLGCGQGRLTIALAERYPDLTILGVDLSEEAIADAAAESQRRGLAGLSFQVADLVNFLANESFKFDMIICTEVLLFFQHPQEIMVKLVEFLDDSGLVLLSVRTPLFYVWNCVQRGEYELALQVLSSSSGKLFPTSALQHSWTTSGSLIREMNSLGFECLESRAIGPCSGLPGDPLHHLAEPSKLGPSAQKQLLQLEDLVGHTHPDVGRYFAALFRKGTHGD